MIDAVGMVHATQAASIRLDASDPSDVEYLMQRSHPDPSSSGRRHRVRAGARGDQWRSLVLKGPWRSSSTPLLSVPSPQMPWSQPACSRRMRSSSPGHAARQRRRAGHPRRCALIVGKPLDVVRCRGDFDEHATRRTTRGPTDRGARGRACHMHKRRMSLAGESHGGAGLANAMACIPSRT